MLIDDVAIEDETDGHEATESDHEASGSCHETTVQSKVKNDLIIVLKEQRNGEKPVVYGHTLKLTVVTIERQCVLHVEKRFLEEEVLLLNSTQATFISM